MLVFNHSLLNRKYILIHVLKALATIISLCDLHVAIYQRLHRDFTLFTNGMFRTLNVLLLFLVG
jgi:hypothetical protein